MNRQGMGKTRLRRAIEANDRSMASGPAKKRLCGHKHGAGVGCAGRGTSQLHTDDKGRKRVRRG